MKKSIRNAAALVLSLVMLVLCFASCGEEAAAKLTVSVAIYGRDSSGADSIYLRDKELEIEAGKTALDAVIAVCEKRAVTYTMNKSDMFETFESAELGKLAAPEQKTKSDGTVQFFHFGWKLNDVVQTTMDSNKLLKDYVLTDGDQIVICVMVDEVIPDKT